MVCCGIGASVVSPRRPGEGKPASPSKAEAEPSGVPSPPSTPVSNFRPLVQLVSVDSSKSLTTSRSSGSKSSTALRVSNSKGSHISSISSRPVGPVETSDTPWSDAERRKYLDQLSIVSLPGEEALAEVLEALLAEAPLVRPWEMKRDQRGRPYFCHLGTGKTTWRHPIEPTLRDVANVCRPFLALPLDMRAQPVLEVKKSWENEVARELSRWHVATDEKGRPYFYNEETEASTWEHPSTSLLPTLYVKIRALDRLCEMGEPAIAAAPETSAAAASSDRAAAAERRGALPEEVSAAPPPCTEPLPWSKIRRWSPEDTKELSFVLRSVWKSLSAPPLAPPVEDRFPLEAELLGVLAASSPAMLALSSSASSEGLVSAPACATLKAA